MQKLIRNLLVMVSAVYVIQGCDIKKNKEAEPDYILKIYNNSATTDSYKPKDVATMPDGSFLVLSTTPVANSSFQGINLSKISKDGEFVKTLTLDENWANTICNIFMINQVYYVVAMERTSLSGLLISIDQDLNATLVATLSSIQYPLSATLDTDNQLVIQSYNREDKETVLSKVNTSGAETARKNFPVGYGDKDVEVPILRHFTREDEALPFLSGSLGGNRFYFNGFYNYHFSTVFFSFTSNNNVRPGYLLGFETDRIINAFLPIGGGNFALSKSDYKNYELIPFVNLNTADAQFRSNDDLKGYKLPELKGNTGIKIKRLTVKGKDVIVYITDTKEKQIALFFYDATSGTLLGTKYLGTSNPFEAGGVAVTADNGLVIIGTCYVGGRYPKICYFSLKENQLTL